MSQCSTTGNDGFPRCAADANTAIGMDQQQRMNLMMWRQAAEAAQQSQGGDQFVPQQGGNAQGGQPSSTSGLPKPVVDLAMKALELSRQCGQFMNPNGGNGGQSQP